MVMTFRQVMPPLTWDRLDAVEREIDLLLPDEYRAFLLEHNGGIPRPDGFSFRVDERCDAGQVPAPSSGKVRKATVYNFFPVGPLPDGAPTRSLQDACARLRQDEVPVRLAAIAEVSSKWSDGTLCLSCDGEDRGRVYFRPGYLESPDEGFFFVAESLPALFDRMVRAARPAKSPQKRAEQAIAEGDLDALSLALAEGIDPTRKNSRNESLLDLAAAAGRDEALLFLIEKGAELDAAFQAAVQARNVPMVLRLLDTGEGPSKPAFFAAWLSWRLYYETELVRAFLARGAYPSRSQRGGEAGSPLHGAAAAGNLEGARLLLDAGADPNIQDGWGDTPLHKLAPDSVGGCAVGLLLLERGARVGIWNNRGWTALHLAASGLFDLDLARRLIDAGEDLHATGQRRDMVDGGEIVSAARSVAMSCPAHIRAELIAYQAESRARRGRA